MGDRLWVVLTDGTSTESRHMICIQVKLENGRCMHVQCNIVPSLAKLIVLGKPFMPATNPQIDWHTYDIKFENGNYLQAVPVALGGSKPSLQEISAKTAVWLAKQQGSAACFVLIKDPQNIQTGLLASASRSSEPLVAVLPQLQSLVQEYHDIFAEPCEPAPGQVTHHIDLHNESLIPPRQYVYRMSPAEVAEAQRQIESMLDKGWIRPFSIPYDAPLLFICKKLGELCMCIDY